MGWMDEMILNPQITRYVVDTAGKSNEAEDPMIHISHEVCSVLLTFLDACINRTLGPQNVLLKNLQLTGWDDEAVSTCKHPALSYSFCSRYGGRVSTSI